MASLTCLSAQNLQESEYCNQAWSGTISPLPSRVQKRDCSSCEARPDLAGECFDVRGRIQFYIGNPGSRMWIIGTNRILGIVPDEYPIAPPKLAYYLRSGIVVYGDYRVCPFSDDRPGFMRFVCIERASNIFVEDYRSDNKKTHFFTGPWSMTDKDPSATAK